MTEAANCPICQTLIEGPNSALCDVCNRPYHLRVRMDALGKDCGDVWIDSQTLALRFACDACLGRAPGAATGEPPLGRAH